MSEEPTKRAPRTRTKIVHLIYENRVAYGKRQKKVFILKMLLLVAIGIFTSIAAIKAYDFMVGTATTITSKTDIESWWNQFKASPEDKKPVKEAYKRKIKKKNTKKRVQKKNKSNSN